MGIKQLSKLVKEKSPKAVIQRKLPYYSSFKIAIDASLALYQFLIAVRTEGSNLGYNDSTTSHLVGMFYRTIKLIETGIIPVYVFDGAAPAMKAIELERRNSKRQKAEKMMEGTTDAGEILKHEKRRVKVDERHVNECKRLFTLMGIPFVTAPSESEAYCAYLCKRGLVKGVATEDMDALCFGTPILLRNLNASQSKKLDIDEYNLASILRDFKMSMESFIDLCILLGCDYCDTLKGVGPKRAFDLIVKHGCIEKILSEEKLEVPENFDYVGARSIFKADVDYVYDGEQLEIKVDQIDRKGLVEFLVNEKGFDEQRVMNGVAKIVGSKGKQGRLDSFFQKTSK